MSTVPGPRSALRRKRAETRKRIVAAARAELERRPWSEISLEEIMHAAGLTRTAFYRHFEDRGLLLLALVNDLEFGFDKFAAGWREDTEDPPRALDGALRELVGFYVQHGRLMQALADSAAMDEDVRAPYLELGERLARLTADVIEREVAAGRSTVRDPLETATALVWMNERFLSLRFGRPPPADPETAAATVSEIWQRTIYES